MNPPMDSATATSRIAWRNRRSGAAAAATDASRFGRRVADDVHLYERSTNTVVLVPPGHIRHMPRRTRSPKPPGARAPLYLCEAYAARGLCAARVACPDVHAVVTAGMPRLHAHVRALAGAAAGTPRLGPAGEWHVIAAGTDHAEAILVEASECLLTAASERLAASELVGLCVHFVTKGVCSFGAHCRFVHPLGQPTPGSPQGEDREDAASSRWTAGVADATSRHRRFRHDPYGAAPGWQPRRSGRRRGAAVASSDPSASAASSPTAEAPRPRHTRSSDPPGPPAPPASRPPPHTGPPDPAPLHLIAPAQQDTGPAGPPSPHLHTRADPAHRGAPSEPRIPP